MSWRSPWKSANRGVIDNDYMVLRTVDKKVWRKNLEGETGGAVDPLAHMVEGCPA